RTVEYTRRAGDRAVALLAYEEAVRHYRMALRAFEQRQAKDDREKCELYLCLGDALAKAGSTAEAKEAFLVAAELARTAELPEHLADAALGYGGRLVWTRTWGDKHLVPLLEEALAALPQSDSKLRARLLARLAAGPLRDTHAPGPRVLMADEAVEMARRLGDPATLAYALEGRCEAYWGPDALDERLALADELIQVGESSGDLERVYAGHDCRFFGLLERGDILAAVREHEAASRLADDLRQPARLWITATRSANLALFEGRFAEAEEVIHEALELGRLAQGVNAELAFDLQLYALRREQGRLEELVDTVERAVDDFPGYPVLRFVLVDVLLELGREQDARTAFEARAAEQFRLDPDDQWLFGLSLLPAACRSLGDAERASMLYEMLLPYLRHNAVATPELCSGSVSRGLGILAGVMSRAEQAAEHFETALEMNSRMGARPWVARTQHDYARMLLADGTPAEKARAAELLTSAHATCEVLGMTALAAKVAALLDEVEPLARPPHLPRVGGAADFDDAPRRA
ncbi:MAG TPA: hypothetical protein VFL41_07430, partial [Gaiellaceae bacterium]|nr:hypothetical protein [Gaiellaceae bacterium]